MIDAQFHIGEILDGPASRDAVHFALAPVIASERLSPGQHIGFVGDNEVGPCDKPLGIVDPFLTGDVSKGDKFWMFLYPNTISSLRHEWSHDAFDAEEEPVSEESAVVRESGEWIADFAEAADLSYNELMTAAKNNIEFDDYLCDGGKWEGFRTPAEFWHHYEVVTGEVVDDPESNFFSCSC